MTAGAPGFHGMLPPARLNLARHLLEAQTAAHPNRPALIVVRDASSPEDAEVWTYAGLEDAVLRSAAALHDLGLAPGDRLLLRLDHSASYAILFLAAAAARIVPVLASSALTASEIAFLIEDAEPAAIVVDPRLAMPPSTGTARIIESEAASRFTRHSRRATYADTAAVDPAYLVYTSGTTSRPKGVLHGHRVVWGRRPMREGWHGMRTEDRVLHAGQLNWTYTLGTGIMDPLAHGATAIVYAGEKDPAVWPRLLRTFDVSMFAAVPSLYRQILKYAGSALDRTLPLRHGLTAGESLAQEVREAWQGRLGTPLFEAFGMSELSTFISSGPSTPPRQGAIGKAQPGRAIAILPVEERQEPLGPGEIGLIAAHRSDPGLMLGYWQRPEEEREIFRGDWFVGGDLGALDADGYATYHGRANDLMNAFGYRVSPLEVEVALEAFPGVAEAAVAEVDAGAGRTIIVAFVVPRPSEALSLDGLLAAARSRLASYKCPRQAVIVGALPRTGNGKLMRKALPVLFAQARAAANR